MIVKINPVKSGAIYVYRKEWVAIMTKPPVFACLVNLSADQADIQDLTITGYLLHQNVFLCFIA